VDRRLEEMADRELTEPAAANEGDQAIDLGGMLREGDEFDASSSPLHPCRPEGWPMTVKKLAPLSGIHHDT
jgi:hypothetical protein